MRNESHMTCSCFLGIAEELEIALAELEQKDYLRQFNTKVEQLEQEVADLHQALSVKKEQEAAVLKVLVHLEKEQKRVEVAYRNAEKEAAALREANAVLQVLVFSWFTSYHK
ncbi:hypothetical protein V6N13_015117 [Hibiscus sabdariffa]|uniref:Uncharacterized protein n=1 Tax=Hibiscus sabdariffa TaxID=183260 RepID=A0ABR2AZZ8_9ROSI